MSLHCLLYGISAGKIDTFKNAASSRPSFRNDNERTWTCTNPAFCETCNLLKLKSFYSSCCHLERIMLWILSRVIPVAYHLWSPLYLRATEEPNTRIPAKIYCQCVHRQCPGQPLAADPSALMLASDSSEGCPGRLWSPKGTLHKQSIKRTITNYMAYAA